MTDPVDELDSKLLLGRYRVVRRLGEGGMGTVHLARLEGAEGFTKPVVVKRMRADIKSTDEGNRLFRREATILSKMHHPGIVNIIDFGVEDGAHIMVLEYVHGYTLAPWLDYRYKRSLPLPVDVCLFIVRKVLDALHYAHHFEIEEGHEAQVVHRDIAPDNVLLSKKGYVHLLDFGVASMSGPGRDNSTKAGVFRGKLGYAAPETVHGHAATPRSDQYSAAVLLLELLIQETPFFSDSMGETIQRMVNEVPPPPSSVRGDIPEGLDQVLGRALSKEPEARFESALEFSRELRKLQKHDDEEIAQQLRELVRIDFEKLPDEIGVEPLRVREEALARELPKGAKVRPLESIVSESEKAALPGNVTQVATAVSAPTGGNQKQLQGILLGLLVVGGLIAVALGAAVALLSRGGTGEQVVVVGGDNPSSGAVETSESGSPSPEASASANSSGSPAPAQAPAQAPAATSDNVVKPAPSAPKPSATAQPSSAPSTEQKLSQAVQAKSSAFQSCFQAQFKAGKTTESATLHFSVAQSGGSAQVQVAPAHVASSSLGGCLKQAASSVSFPPLDRAVSFSVPVKARVSPSP